ncbi:enoyl-CoA hydratase/isomerase family protein [Pseudoalteromonas luteoviolacea]|uniref:enoyl-CoA hydratase-related protein n=1 Tax=Pseudoalteromonas luteoviolacea TaxID=43657 RepID=UPI001B385BBC|nr:enoyl-CoA hydratase-related protein [Pseudoalteromonas luteoviolacea]MBQ4812907.1 enoyl-CoA hydratase/isomerase family protein [Pseudoalteromonas luteoviolacea]
MKTSSMQWARMQLHTKACLSSSVLNQLNHFFSSGSQAQPPTFKVLSGNKDGDFCLGADLSLLSELIESGDKDKLENYGSSYLMLIDQLLCGARDNFTSVAIVQGRAFGAGMLVALAADILIAEPQSEFMNPSILFEQYPCAVLAKKLSDRASSDVILDVFRSGKRYDAQALFELGLIDVVCDKGAAEQQVCELIAHAKQHHCGRIALQNYRNRRNGLTNKTRKQLVDNWVSKVTKGDKRLVQYLRRLGRLQSE